tara:strand:- start:722 stop:1123 length:402 start_codon:yes stop_codon:yes gene_type:complete
MGRKKSRGHYCKICGKSKANENFSGKGHRNHKCKDCAKISPEKRLELMHIGTIYGLSYSKKDRRQLHMFIHGAKYSEHTKAVAREHLEMLKEQQLRYEVEVDHVIMELDETFDKEYDEEVFEEADVDWLDDLF